MQEAHVVGIGGLVVLTPALFFSVYNWYCFERTHQKWLAFCLSASLILGIVSCLSRFYSDNVFLLWGYACLVVSSIFATAATVLVNRYWAQFISVTYFRVLFSEYFIVFVGLSSVGLYCICAYYNFKNDLVMHPDTEHLYTISQCIHDIYFAVSTCALGWTMIIRYKNYLQQEIALLDFSEKHMDRMRGLVRGFSVYLALIVSSYMLKTTSLFLSRLYRDRGGFGYNDVQTVMMNYVIPTALLSVGLILVVKPQTRKSHVSNVEEIADKLPSEGGGEFDGADSTSQEDYNPMTSTNSNLFPGRDMRSSTGSYSSPGTRNYHYSPVGS